MKKSYATGADESPYDLRTFAYKPSGVVKSGGVRYDPKDIEDQHKVGICTAISLTQNARKARGIKYSADFQYLLQKKYVDGNWNEGSSLSSALKVARGKDDANGKFIYGGLLPEKDWKFTTEKDRKLPYEKYIKKLQAISDADIQKLFKISQKHRIFAYSKVPVDRDLMAQAILESKAGLLTRYPIGKEWWSKPIEPIQPPKVQISGHAVTDSNFDGDSFRIANTWGIDWADKGTAYRLQGTYAPTEAWLVHYDEVPDEVQKQLDARKNKLASIVDLLQKVVVLYQQLNALKK